MRTLIVGSLVAVVGVLAGCGGGGDKSQGGSSNGQTTAGPTPSGDKLAIEQAFEAFERAAKAKDAATACATFTPEGRRQYEQLQADPALGQPAIPCQQAIGDGLVIGDTLMNISVHGGSATAQIVSSDAPGVAAGPINFQKMAGEWKISQFGPFT